ncbi:uncharacterized protein LOC134183770 isoform X2 [Corticium candelabrum]|uniref:uncharacterized protein LOC134183770 isoform X2 n=1 Tax=Corticium candelabrum TaxID=121492 RepID=UPI002E2666CA|nr:uncharacterized protein LOC134183770 isoform X2 [Corticium candelabrum]
MEENQSSRAIDDALFDAVVQKDVEKASEAIAKSADVNVVARNWGWYGTGLGGYPSALQVACGVGSTDMVDVLIRKEANVKYQEKGMVQNIRNCFADEKADVVVYMN